LNHDGAAHKGNPWESRAGPQSLSDWTNDKKKKNENNVPFILLFDSYSKEMRNNSPTTTSSRSLCGSTHQNLKNETHTFVHTHTTLACISWKKRRTV
jgi:hypothetical protein